MALCALFVVWFGSGIVMMYADYPNLTAAERLETIRALSCGTCSDSVARGILADRAGRRAPTDTRLGMLLDRPVWRLTDSLGVITLRAADNGELLGARDAVTSREVARDFVRLEQPALREAGRLMDADQWTLTRTVRNQMPLRRWDVADGRGTRLYVSDGAAEVVHHSTRAERLLAWIGAIPHWIYPTVLRRHANMWAWLVIVLSAVGTVMSVTGLVIGVWHFRWRQRTAMSAQRAGDPLPRVPYRSTWMRWHHLLGLGFGVTTCTWVFSGMMSMNPLDWSPGSSATPGERLAWSGASPSPATWLVGPRAAWEAASRTVTVKEMQPVVVRGVPWWLAVAPAGRTLLVRGDTLPLVVASALDPGALSREVGALLPAAAVQRVDTLRWYDAYYRDMARALPLPVLRVEFDDRERTTFYLDPATGAIARRMVTRSRWERWLYAGLHEFDLPWFGYQRPLRDIVLIGLSLGGMALSVTGLRLGWRRSVALVTGERPPRP